jgi:hypothetical protein
MYTGTNVDNILLRRQRPCAHPSRLCAGVHVCVLSVCACVPMCVYVYEHG